ncbi:hypothetical protein LPJ66_007969, partial [Kickxella alabastrina]
MSSSTTSRQSSGGFWKRTPAYTPSIVDTAFATTTRLDPPVAPAAAAAAASAVAV